ncbi:hypothetical protein IPM19_03410 [bacterium]|nr:MAG: hypothetical protein IPM19_03410 [bacterium]
MPKLSPRQLTDIEFCEPDLIFRFQPRTSLAQVIFDQRMKEHIHDSGFRSHYEESYLNDDGRNSIIPGRAIWPWPTPKDMEFDDFFTEEDYQSAFPMSSVRPQRTQPALDLTVLADEAERSTENFFEHEFEEQRQARLLEEFEIGDRAEAYGERLRNYGI